MSQNLQQRDASIDNAKGILILMVVGGHVFVRGASQVPVDLIYLVHMPLFFVYGCYFGKPLSTKVIRDKALRLLLPFIALYLLLPQLTSSLVKGIKVFSSNQPAPTWLDLIALCLVGATTLISLVLHLSINIHFHSRSVSKAIYLSWVLFTGLLALSKNDLVADLQRLGMANWASVRTVLWFLPAMFSLSLVYGLLLKLKVHHVLIFSAVVILPSSWLIEKLQAYHGMIPFGLDVAFLIAPLAYVLIYWSKKAALQLSDNQKTVFILTFFTAWILALIYLPHVTVNKYSKQLDMAQLNLPHLLIIACICLPFMIGVSMFKQPTLLAKLGQSSMPIFAIHMTILTLINPSRPLFETTPDLSYWIITTLVTGVSFLIGLGFKKLDPRFSYLGLA